MIVRAEKKFAVSHDAPGALRNSIHTLLSLLFDAQNRAFCT